MNKTEFLQKLREKLSILEDGELEDILSEYEQHIDMKTAGTMTEEEAIADFGNLDDLAAQILEAYHVRADFSEQKPDGNADETGRSGRRITGMLGNGWKKIMSSIKQGAAFCKDGIHTWVQALVHFLGRNKKEQADSRQQEMKPEDKGKAAEKERTSEPLYFEESREKPDKSPKAVRGIGGTCGRFVQWCMRCVKRFWRWCMRCVKCLWQACVWCVKLCWNLFWGTTGITIGLLACAGLFVVGTLLVLVILHYPLWGVAIGCLGLTMGAAALAGLCYTLLPRNRQKKRLRIVLGSIFLIGVLSGGIGVGIAFGEYSSMQYQGTVYLGEENLVTEQLVYEYEPVADKKLLLEGNYWAGETELKEDASVPMGQICYEVTYNPELTRLELLFEEAHDWEEEESYSYLYLQSLRIKSEFDLMMENKDRILEELKQKKIASYRTLYITKAEIRVNPGMMEYIEMP